MNKLLNPKNLPVLTVGLGVIGLGLRWLLYAVASDAKNLLPLNHPLEILLWLVTVAAVALIVFTVWKLEGSNRYADNFSASVMAAAGHFVAAAGILLTVLLTDMDSSRFLVKIWKLLGILSAPALVLAGLSRMQGKCPVFLTHMVVCLFFVLHILNNYQLWSGNPQLQDYFFSLFGCAALMLFAFYQAAFEVGSGKRRMQLATGLLAVYSCCVALSGSGYPMLYFGGAVWAFTDLCALKPVPRRQRPAMESE